MTTLTDTRVTIVVPAYNAARFLETTLESVKHQTYRNWECIVVDDCSTDTTRSIARKYAASDPRFVPIVHHANGGPAAARNTGLRRATGEYVCFLDADDLLTTTSVQVRLETLQKANNHRLAGSYSASQIIDEAATTVPTAGAVAGMVVIDFITAAAACPFNMNQPLVKTEVLRHLGGFDESFQQAEDMELWLRILRHGYHFVPTGTTEVTYRSHGHSHIRTAPLTHLASALQIVNAAHAALPVDQTYDDVPFVYAKPWVVYRKQLDVSARVLEFCGMAHSSGVSAVRLAKVFAGALPDFVGAISPHRDVPEHLERGVDRQVLGGPATADSRGHALRDLASTLLTSDPSLGAKDEAAPSGTPLPFSTHHPGFQKGVDIAFLAHNDYHVWTLSLLLGRLAAADVRYVFVDPTLAYGNERATRKLRELGLPRVSYCQFLLGRFRPKMLVCMNDWEPLTRSVAQACKTIGIPTVGIVEGVQDYLDVDTGRPRGPYRTVDYVILPGAFDRRYFPTDDPRIRVGGMPRIDALLAEPVAFPATHLVIINCNFTYGVLSDQRQDWLRQAVAACEEVGVEYIISQHPADGADLTGYPVADESMYDLLRRGSVFVSRFSSGILESLALGKPAIYFNPHNERVDKFSEPQGAFAIAESVQQLSEHLRAALAEPNSSVQHTDRYLHLHCGTHRGGALASRRVAEELLSLLDTADIPNDDRRALIGRNLMARDRPSVAIAERPRPTLKRPAGDDQRASDSQFLRFAAWGARSLSPRYAQRLERLRKKYAKLRRDPKAFFADSRLPLKTLTGFF